MLLLTSLERLAPADSQKQQPPPLFHSDAITAEPSTWRAFRRELETAVGGCSFNTSLPAASRPAGRSIAGSEDPPTSSSTASSTCSPACSAAERAPAGTRRSLGGGVGDRARGQVPIPAREAGAAGAPTRVMVLPSVASLRLRSDGAVMPQRAVFKMPPNAAAAECVQHEPSFQQVHNNGMDAVVIFTRNYTPCAHFTMADSWVDIFLFCTCHVTSQLLRARRAC